MNFLDIQKKFEEDTRITKENIRQKNFDVPILHAKFHKFLYQWRRQLLKVEKEKQTLYRELYYFYKTDFEHALDEKAIKWHIETDSKFMDVNERYQILKYEVDQIQQMVEYCSKLSFFTKVIVDYEIFLNGG